MAEDKNIDLFFKNLESFLETSIKPIAPRLDTDASLLHNHFLKLLDLGVHKLFVPKIFGGYGGDRSTQIKFNILMSQYSGALHFLEAQHQHVVYTLAQQPLNENLTTFFKRVCDDNLTVGVFLNSQGLDVSEEKDTLSSSTRIFSPQNKIHVVSADITAVNYHIPRYKNVGSKLPPVV